MAFYFFFASFGHIYCFLFVSVEEKKSKGNAESIGAGGKCTIVDGTEPALNWFTGQLALVFKMKIIILLYYY